MFFLSKQKTSLHPLDALKTVYTIDFNKEDLAKALARTKMEEQISAAINEQGFPRAMAMKEAIADKLEEIESFTHALKVRECFCSGERHVFSSGRTVWYPHLHDVEHNGQWIKVGGCGLPRLCPFHGRIDTRRRITKYLPHVEQAARTNRIQLVTLTVPNAPRGGLKSCMDGIWAAFNRLRRSKIWTATGSIVTLEMTFNKVTGSWNVHLHALIAVPYQRNFDWKGIQARWQRLTGALVVDFQQVKRNGEGLTGGLLETLKYVSKFDDVAELDTDDFFEWYHAIFRHRTLRTHGIWNRLEDIKLDDEDEAVEGEQLIGVLQWHWVESEKAVHVFLIQVNNSTTALDEIRDICFTKRQREREKPPRIASNLQKTA